MIKVNELRIGNLAKSYGTNGSPNDWIDITVNSGHISTCSIYPELFKPIPLTEEWLVKFGVKQISMNMFEHIYSGIILECSYNLQYIHQLQNLYFALTGEELTWKQ